MVRLAKDGYNYGGLSMYSVDQKALPFDQYIHHVGERDRKTASSKARKSLSKECILVFSTLSTAGGARLKNLKMSFDIIIQDKAGQALEPESLIPVTSTRKQSIHGRCHQVLVGDAKQLPAVSNGRNMVRGARKKFHFNYDDQLISLFQRLQRNQRASCVMLTTQYKMHPTISAMHSSIFYEGKVKSGVSASALEESYNAGWKKDSFAPVTMIDTSRLPDRFELNDNKGSITNCMEVNIIDETLESIRNLSRNDFAKLKGEIAVLLPYRVQVDQAKHALSAFGKYVDRKVSREGFDILVGTVDAMQGSEADIIIFASTRSNMLQEVGFLDHPNRLNVAISRARKLLIIISDITTMASSNPFGKFWDYCMAGRNGSMLLRREPIPNGRSTGHSVVKYNKFHEDQFS